MSTVACPNARRRSCGAFASPVSFSAFWWAPCCRSAARPIRGLSAIRWWTPICWGRLPERASVRRTRIVVVVAATLGTAAAVSVSGLIAFVGIIVPHTVRLLVGRSYRTVLPLSLLFGAAFLVLADLLARTLISPAELPIGVVTAFFGAPFFLIVLRTSRVRA